MIVRMQNSTSKLARFAILALFAVVIAMLLLMFWVASAGEPWSSDPWLMNTALAVALSGPIALLILAFMVWHQKR